MRIKSLYLNSFGAFQGQKKDFNEGFNYIALPNEEGKSTMIEALAVSFYGFTKANRYAYLPHMTGTASTTMDLDLEYGLGRLSIHRESTGNNVTGSLLYLERKEKMKGSLLSAIKGLAGQGLMNFDENLSREDCFITSDSLKEHRDVLDRAKKKDIGFFETVDYRGRAIDELIEQRKNEMSAIYTNNKNSHSRYKLLENERNQIRDSLLELNDKNREIKDEYESYQAKMMRVYELKKEEEALLEEKRLKELELERAKLLRSYQDIIKEEVGGNYSALKTMPSLQSYEIKKKELLLSEERSAELDRKYRDINFLEEDGEILKLIEIEKAEGLDLKLAFTKLVNYSSVQTQKEDRRAKLDELDFYSDELDVAEASREARVYMDLLSDLRDVVEEKPSPVLPLVALGLVLGSLILAFFFREQLILALIALGLGLGALGLLSLSFFTTSQDKKVTKNKREIVSMKLRHELSEIKKLSLVRTLIAEEKALDEGASRLIELVFKSYNEYSELVKEEERLKEEIVQIFSARPETRYILKLKPDRSLQLAESFLAKADVLRDRKFEKDGLMQAMKQEEVRTLDLRSELKAMRDYYADNFGTIDTAEVEALIEKRIRAEAKKEELFREARKIDFSLDEAFCSLEGDVDYYRAELERVEAELDGLGEKIGQMNEESLRLEAKLSEKPLISNKRYENYSLEELQKENLKLALEQEELIKSYNRLALEIAVLQEMTLVAKEKMRPKFIERASRYFKLIAPECKLVLDMNVEGNIVFIQEESRAELPFMNLSTGTKGQFLLALKLAFLDELDEEGHYPLVVDDAFMAYDARRYERAMDLLKEIAEKRQVLYFEALRSMPQVG